MASHRLSAGDLSAGWEKARLPAHVAQPRAGSGGQQYAGKQRAMQFEKGEHKIPLPLSLLGDTISKEVDLGKKGCKIVLTGREAGVCATPLSWEHMCWQGEKNHTFGI